MSAFRLSLATALVLLACADPGAPAEERQVLNPDSPAVPKSGVVVEIDIGLDSAYVDNFMAPRSPFLALGVTMAGTRVPLTNVRWASSAPEIVRVDSLAGSFMVIADGRARVTATWQGLRDEVQLIANFHCRGPHVALSGPTRLRVGEQGQWNAVISTCEPREGDFARFSSSDSTILSMTAEGLGVARKAGLVTVTATTLVNSVSVAVYVDP